MKRRNFLSNISLVVSGSTLLNFTALGKNTPGNNDQDNNTLNSKDDKKVTRFHVTVPSTVGLNETFWVGLRVLTEPFIANWIPKWQRVRATVDGPFNQSPRGTRYMENVLPQWDGLVKISGGEGYVGPKEYSFSTGSGPYESDKRPVRRLENFSFNKPGIKYIRITDPVSGIEAISNPIHVAAEATTERLFWGDLHCHSFFGDGIRSPEEIYAFARDESFLDVLALTEHTEALTNAQWNYFREVTNTFNEPDRFVTFIGGEWTSSKYGHRNFIYPGIEGPIIRSSDPEQNDLHKLYALARHHKALIIANHTASPGHTTHWDNGHDPEVERLVEVYSIGGVNEIPAGEDNSFSSRIKKGEVIGSHVIDGLKRGFHLGLIGVGDNHDGRPGDALHHLQEKPIDYRFLRGPGLMGVWAKDLTRESVFDALWNRRVYGTTNNRTWLKFSINGHPMGSQITVDGKMAIKVEAASNLVIQRIDLVREGKTVQFLEPKRLEASWSPKEKYPSAGTWYYVRVSLDGEHLAWSSPIWVTL